MSKPYEIIETPNPDGNRIGAAYTHVYKLEVTEDKPQRIVVAKDYNASQDMSIRLWISRTPHGIKVQKDNANLSMFSLTETPTELFISMVDVTDNRNIYVSEEGMYYINVQNISGKENGYKMYVGDKTLLNLGLTDL